MALRGGSLPGCPYRLPMCVIGERRVLWEDGPK